MAGEKLQVSIGADISDLKTGINDAVIQLEKLRQQKVKDLKLGLDVSALNSQISQAKEKISSFQSAISNTGGTMQTFQKKTADGGAALTSFSRIAQDAPYGIIGVGNNITNTAEQFGALVKQTGSAGGALKALLSSLAGVGGILLGVSLLTTGLTLLSQSGLTVGDVIDKLTGKFDEFGNEVKKTSEEAIKNTSGEIFGLKSLITIAQDEMLSRKQRIAAVDELQKRYPGYFGNLSKEAVMTSDLTKTTNELAQALINRQIAENLAKSAAPQLQKLYMLNGLYRKQRDALDEQNIEVRRAIEVYGENSQTTKEAIATQDGLYNQLERTRGQIYQQTQVVNKYTDSINMLNKASSKLLIGTETTKAPKEQKAPKEPKKPKFQFEKGFIPGGIVQPNLNFDSALLQMDIVPDVVDENLKKAEQRMLEFNNNINSIISDSIANTFSKLGTVIGESLVSGADILASVGQTLMQSLSGLLSAIGNELIKLGTAAVLAGTVTKTFGTITGIGAGLAAIAGGVALNAIGGSLGASANKNVQSASVSGRGGYNTSYSSSSSGYAGNGLSGNVVFEISGQKLIGVLNNTLNGNKRLGGAVGLG